jgi:hypothetical protein
MKIRGGKASTQNSVKGRNVDLGSINEIGQAVSGSQARHEAAKQKSYVTLDPEDILKVSNPREVYCSLNEFKAVSWPALDIDTEILDAEMVNALLSAPWFLALSTAERERAKSFFMGIHELSCSLVDNGQIQAIVLERDDPQSRNVRLIAGERRTLAALYSRGEIATLNAEIWNLPLDELKRAKIKDQENAKEGLTPAETIESKWGIYSNLPSANSMPLSQLSRELAYKTISIPSQLRRIYENPNKDKLIWLIKSENSGWRRITELIQLVEKDPSVIDKILQKTGESSMVKEEGKSRSKVIVKPSDRNIKEAAKFGLVLKSRTNLSLVKLLLESALSSAGIPEDIKSEIKKYDLSTVETITQCWAALGEELEREVPING